VKRLIEAGAEAAAAAPAAVNTVVDVLAVPVTQIPAPDATRIFLLFCFRNREIHLEKNL